MIKNLRGQYKNKMLLSSIIILVGILLSGPVGTLVSTLIKPQPTWVNIDTFISNYDPIQTLPFVLGFLLLIGFVLFVSNCYLIADEKNKHLVLAAVVFTSIFASLVFMNYTIQIAYVPNAFDQNRDILSILTMSNPKSICWAFEMFAYGALGIATLFIAPIFNDGKIQSLIKYIFVLNGIISVAGAMITAIDLAWVFTVPGLISYTLWNILIVIAMILIIVDFRKIKD